MARLPEPLRKIAERMINAVRVGPRLILWTPPKIGVGNLLYLWLWARTSREAGEDAWVLEVTAMHTWLDEFPSLRELTIARKQVGLRDRRTVDYAQTWGEHYAAEQLRSFARELIVEKPFASRVAQLRGSLGENTLVINVRRGDYYSVAEHRERYGMNVQGWIRHALPVALGGSHIEKIQLVSDDLDWCARELGWLQQSRPTSFERLGSGPSDDLAVLASAQSLILTNSTFSYWGAHLNGAMHDKAGNSIVAPAFHIRGMVPGDRSWHLDPNWTIVESIPGGWDEPSQFE